MRKSERNTKLADAMLRGGIHLRVYFVSESWNLGDFVVHVDRVPGRDTRASWSSCIVPARDLPFFVQLLVSSAARVVSEHFKQVEKPGLWSEQEECLLLDMFSRGVDERLVSLFLSRSLGAIRARLLKLGVSVED